MSTFPSGDDLDDGFEVDVLVSDAEIEMEGNTLPVAQESTRKRKRKAEKVKAIKKQKVEGLEAGKGKEQTLATQSPGVQAQYISDLQKNVYKDVSPPEINKLRFAESCFLDTQEYKEQRTLDKLPRFIEAVAPRLQTRLSQRPANKGAPTLLVIASSAIRAAEIVKVLRPMRGAKGGEVGKLFAKHFKVEQHAEYLRRTSICAGVGTAGRIGQLLSGETKSLSLQALTHIIIDASYRDAKTMTIFDIADTRASLLKGVLGNADLKKLVDGGKVTIVLF